MIEIAKIGDDFDRWQDLLALIMTSFAYMDGVIDPIVGLPSDARKSSRKSQGRNRFRGAR